MASPDAAHNIEQVALAIYMICHVPSSYSSKYRFRLILKIANATTASKATPPATDRPTIPPVLMPELSELSPVDDEVAADDVPLARSEAGTVRMTVLTPPSGFVVYDVVRTSGADWVLEGGGADVGACELLLLVSDVCWLSLLDV